ncbi:replication initiation factor domain-containing protein [Oscillatoria acuminata]|uniref:Putative phage replication protein RstA n=1 Tax=Oscillatoria acuminata PCC 6304 TaxID=56110 RepID=K9TFS0_9CYAN|nr:replication initiation factor domain-containing protein [Oscillatoria acuminata]AFY81248.1 putative phage replication protein RstA [Oscillatoria acuminata PCC 6304]
MSLACGIHGFNLTFEGSQFESLRFAIEAISSLKFTEGACQLWWYPEVLSNAIGIKIARNADRPESLLAVPGGACDLLGPSKVQEILQLGLNLRLGRVSQIDIFIDDFDRRWPPKKVEESYLAGHCYGFRVFRQISSGNFPRKLLEDIQDNQDLMSVGMGTTFELGNRGQRGSGKRFKVYDKSIESRGKNKAIRYELSLYNISTKKRADEISKFLAFSPVDDWQQIIASTFKSCIDFRLGTRGRSGPVPEWYEIIGDVEPLSLLSAPKQNSLERTKEWLERCAPAIATVLDFLEATGGERSVLAWVNSLQSQGRDRMGTKHLQSIEQALLEKSSPAFHPSSCDRSA